MTYLTNIVIGIDQLINTLIGGEPDETLSSHAWRMERDHKPWGFLRFVIDMLFFWQMQHCRDSYESERRRMQLPPEFRTTYIK